MYKIKLHKTSKCLWPIHIDMYVVKWMGFFDVFINHFPKIHRSVLRKIAIDLLYFWDVHDANLWEKNSGRSNISRYIFQGRSSHWEAFPKNSCFAMYLFLLLSKPGEIPVTDFILVVYLSALPVCYFTKEKGWIPCQIIFKVYDHKSC